MLFRRNSEICERTGKGSGRAGGEKIRKENRKKRLKINSMLPAAGQKSEMVLALFVQKTEKEK